MKRHTAQGFTLAELLFVAGLISVLAAVTLPALSKARLASNESTAIASLRVIHSAQQAFSSACGTGYYSPSLQNLGIPAAGNPGFLAADLSRPAPVAKSGYDFDMDSTKPVTGRSCNGGGLVVTYHATADPLPGQGTRYFGMNTQGAIFQAVGTLFGVMPDSGAAPAPAVPISQ